MDVEQQTGTEQPSVVEWGGGPVDRPGWFGSGRSTTVAGLGCAFVGFALLLAAELLPWVSVRTSALGQDFPTVGGGRIGYGIAELAAYTGMFNFGWLIVLAAVATALALRPPARRVAVAAGLGLVAGQLALLVGVTHGVRNVIQSRGGLTGGSGQLVESGAGMYCAYAALVLFAAALLVGGAPVRLRRSTGVAEEPELPGPADLTVTPAPPGHPVPPPAVADPSVWSRGA
ncbi:hypothetical protein HC031_04375 [Planosporangium thailandense]|uniref:Uncharacterized protein n=1 Tax=Planosporangium thailandense TaxID=765197 RepID=A0ABX0XT33_9ACTN|nr:hypothetical protein [Planosporangium thailandense]NJC68966.1 hypothetical protein [Planosporangium thailandense]